MVICNWDDAKNKINIIKHGVDFVEAATTFNDEDALVIYDEEHSDDEERFILIGLSSCGNVLVTCHCYRDNDEVIRIISSRKADKEEALVYFGGK